MWSEAGEAIKVIRGVWDAEAVACGQRGRSVESDHRSRCLGPRAGDDSLLEVSSKIIYCTFVYDLSRVVNASCPRHPRHLPLDHGVRWQNVRATVLRDLLAKHGRGNCGVESAAIFFVAEVKP